jgi:thermostable 8-oxoguanine DNA glycosylase
MANLLIYKDDSQKLAREMQIEKIAGGVRKEKSHEINS